MVQAVLLLNLPLYTCYCSAYGGRKTLFKVEKAFLLPQVALSLGRRFSFTMHAQPDTLIRIVILKQWKKPKTIYKNLMKLNKAFGCNMTHEDIYKVAHSSLGLYRRCGMDVVNYLLSQKVLAIPNKKENRPGLVDPLAYYLRYT